MTNAEGIPTTPSSDRGAWSQADVPATDRRDNEPRERSRAIDGEIISGPRIEHPAPRSFLHELIADERMALESAAAEQTFWPQSPLCRQEDITDDVILIKRGWVKVIMEIGGRQKIVAVRGPGDIVGERAAIAVVSRSATVVALDTVQALVIPAMRFRELITDRPRILEVLARQERRRQAEDASGRSGHPQPGAEHRLAGLLLELAERWGDRGWDGAVTITVPLTVEELADWVDMAPATVTAALTGWHHRRVIQAAHHQIMVLDAAGLQQICDAGAAGLPASPSIGTDLTNLPLHRPLNCSIFFTDVVAFGDPRRDDEDRLVVRHALYRILAESFEASGVPWDGCVHEDRGDGTLSIVPPNHSTVSLVDPLLALLAAKLKRHNRQSGVPVRIQLRVALHVGPVARDDRGLCGAALIHAARLLEAPSVKRELADTGADLAVIASSHVYQTVIRHSPGLVDAGTYRPVPIQLKEESTAGWLHLAGAAMAGAGTCAASAVDL